MSHSLSFRIPTLLLAAFLALSSRPAVAADTALRARHAVPLPNILTSLPAAAAETAQSSASALALQAPPLPIRRVTLYKHGVAYFERFGSTDGRSEIILDFKASEMNDVLK